jgi:hypothetical protein
MQRRSLFVLALALAASSGCNRHRAAPADCIAVLDRLVDLELTESGYRDPVVRARWQANLRRRLAPDIEQCRGMSVPNDLISCLSTTKGAEDLTHRCLK